MNVYTIFNSDGSVLKTISTDSSELLELNTPENCYYKIGDFSEPMNSMYIERLLKTSNVSSIKVTTSTGKVFDGDELSQDRIMRAINIASITGEVSTLWKLADNSTIEVTIDELKEALALAGKEMSRIWLN